MKSSKIYIYDKRTTQFSTGAIPMTSLSGGIYFAPKEELDKIDALYSSMHF